MTHPTPERCRLLAPRVPVALASAAYSPRPARAQESWPTKPLTIIVPQAAGGGSAPAVSTARPPGTAR
jgi:hypothetical protein